MLNLTNDIVRRRGEHERTYRGGWGVGAGQAGWVVREGVGDGAELRGPKVYRTWSCLVLLVMLI